MIRVSWRKKDTQFVLRVFVFYAGGGIGIRTLAPG